MIRLRSISIANFRSIGRVDIQPSYDLGSMTALSGANGSGKSSVVYALVWCLYGQTPDGVPVSGIRRQGASTDDECFVKVVFEHDQQVVEVTRAVKGARNASVAVITVDGVEVTVASTKAATGWVTKRLGVDCDGFLSAVTVMQKELEFLLKARPAERKKLIERLAGIERMSRAAEIAREKEGDVRKLLAATPDVSELVNSCVIHVADEKAKCRLAEDSLNAVLSDLTSAQEDHAAAAEEFTKVSELWSLFLEISRGQEKLETEIAKEESLLEQQRSHAQRLSLQVDESTLNTENVDELRDELSGLELEKEQWALSHSAVTGLRSKLSEVRDSIAQTEGELASAQGAFQKARADLESSPSAKLITMRIQESRDALAKGDEALGGLRAEHSRIMKAVEALTGTAEATCPTCNQTVPSPDELLDGLKVALAAVVRSGVEMKADLDAQRSSVDDLSAQLLKVQQLEQALDRHRDNVTRLQAALSEKTDRQSALAEQIKNLESKLPTEAQAQELTGRVRDLTEVIASFDSKRKLLTEIDNLNQEIASIEGKILGLKAAKARGAEKLAELKISVSEVEACKEREDAAAARVSALLVAKAEADGELKLARQSLAQAEATLERNQQSQKRRDGLVKELEAATTTREALVSFREDRLGRLTPELSEHVTDLVNTMSGGRYVSVDLDDNFTPSVTDSEGLSRPASWLSGGEEAIVALALRVAIGEVLTGGSGGLLVLDEVLTAQDSERRSLMMSAIRELSTRQVLMINHVAEASDMADTVVEFLADPVNGSSCIDRGISVLADPNDALASV